MHPFRDAAWPIIPFDTYNLFYRDGRIEGIRAAMRTEAHA
jgi:hypothetical protein